jgi:PAS domain S-box-containing protein
VEVPTRFFYASLGKNVRPAPPQRPIPPDLGGADSAGDLRPAISFLGDPPALRLAALFSVRILSAWVGGLRGGLVATVLSTGLVWYIFIPPRFSFAIENPAALVSVGIFVSMGVLVSYFHERLWRANELAEDAQFRALFEQALVGMTQVGLDDRFQRVNQRLCEIVGYNREELLDKTLQEITHPDELGADVGLLPKALASERSTCILERQWLRKNHSSVKVNLSVTLARETSGAPKYFILVVEDVTERKHAAVATAQLAAIVQSSLDAIIGKTLDGTITSWNAGAEKIFGYAAEEMIGCSITKLIPPDRQGDEEKILARIKRGKSVQHFEAVRVKKEGGWIDISVTVSPIKDASGEIVGASKVARDITAQKQAEKKLKESEERFRTLVETAPEAIFIQANRRFAYLTAAALRLFGTSRPDELLGQPVLD